METIIIGFSTNKSSMLSKIIKSIENSNYSHVYIRRKSKYGEYVYQASGLQVNFMNIDIFLKNNNIVEEYEFEFPDNKKEKLLEFFVKYAGAGYSISSLFKILAIVSAKRIGYNLKFNGDKDNSFICSELGAFMCEEILEIPIDSDIDFISPKMLNPIIRKYGKAI